ncbi:hypothetical protein [Tepidimonas taiwanensis]|uniref:hypothetical protein n=1 Tax=Tepidimonas taiwanensis TaxID=307486 RepID=UPI0012E002F4|nr:hypothetical protein [Tepidimonas taiwanensis]
MELPWTRARDLIKAASRLERERLLLAAVAARAAQADEKDWQKWVAQVSAE